MSKINIKVSIDNSEINNSFETKAIIQDDVLKYKEQDNTLTTFDYNNNTLIRENNDLRLKYRFSNEKTHGIINIKELNKELLVDIETKKIERKENDIKISFIVEENEFLYQIEVIK